MSGQVVKQKVGRNDPLLTVYDGEMTNQIKSIIIVAVVIIVLYYIMSPYQISFTGISRWFFVTVDIALGTK